MATHPGRLTHIITGMVEAFAGAGRPREVQIEHAVELVLATNPTPEELADAREELLTRSQEASDLVQPGEAHHDYLKSYFLKDRAAKAEALAIAESRLPDLNPPLPPD